MALFKKKTTKLDNYSRKNGVGLVTYDDPTSTISEQFNTIRTNIQFSSVDKKLNSIPTNTDSSNSADNILFLHRFKNL